MQEDNQLSLTDQHNSNSSSSIRTKVTTTLTCHYSHHTISLLPNSLLQRSQSQLTILCTSSVEGQVVYSPTAVSNPIMWLCKTKQWIPYQ